IPRPRSSWTWGLLPIVLVFTLSIRIRLSSMPLERDEGEYAYAGQLILQGIAPYVHAYNMKFPGIYGAYALIMAICGQTAWGIHIGLALINAATIIVIFRLGRRLLDDHAAVVAAASYALLSTSDAVHGLAANSEHFVVLPALVGILLLLDATKEGRIRTFFW